MITLGVIGVVAALTIPAIVSKYNRQNAQVRLKKFYSIMNQAVTRSIEENGEISTYTPSDDGGKNSEVYGKWVKENITKYMTTIKNEKLNDYYYQVVFMDGSGVQFYGTTNMYIFYKLNFNTKSSTRTNADGKNEFVFVFDGKQILPIFNTWSKNDLKRNCYQVGDVQRFGCAALIMKSGWEIPEDYPWLK